MAELKRDLGVWGAAIIGIGAIIGTGIFVLLGVAAGLAFYLNPNAVIYGGSWIAIGIVVYLLNKWRIKRKHARDNI